MLGMNSKIIAIDFDGTIVEDMYPEIGKPKPFVFDTLKKMQNDGHRLILWTYRHGIKLHEAVEFCKKNGIEFYTVNKSYPEEVFTEKEASRKIHADVFIDDRNFRGFPGWGEIYQEMFGANEDIEKAIKRSTKKKSWFRF